MLLTKFKKYIYPFIALLLIFGAIGCQKTLDLNVNTFEPAIAIFGVLEADSVPKLFITESEPYYTYINRELEYKLIENASITITDGNNTWDLKPDSIYYIPIEQYTTFWGVDQGSENSGGKVLAFTTNIKLNPNTTYTVSVTKNNTTAKATANVLSDVGSFDAEIKEELIEYYYGDFVREVLDVKFKSQAHGQFYRTLVRRTNKYYSCTFENGIREPLDTFIHDYISYYSYDEIADSIDVQNQKVFFNSGNCTIRTCIDENEFLDFREIEVAVQVMDSNMVKYVNQLQTQEEVAYNPFLEPAPVDQQVENGIGILSSSAISQWKTFKILCD